MSIDLFDHRKLKSLFKRGAIDPVLIERLGSYYLESGDVERARETFQRALLIDNRTGCVTPLLFKLGICHLRLGKFRQARDVFLSIASHWQSVPELHFNLGKAIEGLGDFKSAAASVKRSIDLSPSVENFWVEYLILLRLSSVACATVLSDIELALTHHPRSTALLNLKAECLLSTGNFPEALALTDSIPRKDAMSLYSRGVIFQECGHNAKAEASYIAALTIDSNFADAHMNLGLIYLSESKFSEGWSRYTRRWHAIGFHSRPMFGYSGIRVQRQELLEDCVKAKDVLIFAEQGLGEQLLFSTCLPDLMKLNRNLRVVVDQRLVRLFSNRFSVRCEPMSGVKPGALAAKGTTVIAAGDLPFLFRNKIDEFRGTSRIDGNKFPAQSDTQVRSLRIGLCLGSTNPLFGRRKAVAPSVIQRFIPVSAPFEFVNLDHTLSPDQFISLAATVSAVGSVDSTFSAGFNSFDVLTQQIDSCDLVLCASCTVAHLAGFLEKKTIVFVTESVKRKFWYWSNSIKNQSLWYPTVQVEDIKSLLSSTEEA